MPDRAQQHLAQAPEHRYGPKAAGGARRKAIAVWFRPVVGSGCAHATPGSKCLIQGFACQRNGIRIDPGGRRGLKLRVHAE
jgi:hypothetical protein